MSRCISATSRKTLCWLLSIVTLILMFTSVSGKVYAADSEGVDSIMQIPSGSAAAVSSIALSSGSYKGDTILSVSGTTLIFKNATYYALEVDEKREFMEKLLSTVTKANIAKPVKNKLFNFISNQDTALTNSLQYLKNSANADFVEARKWFVPFSGGISTVLGVICVLIFLFTGISTTIDIFYLAIPGFRTILEGDTKKRERPVFVSPEAFTSLRDSEEGTTYKNVYSLYIKRRLWVIFLVMICVGYLISGKIYDLVAYFIDAFTF